MKLRFRAILVAFCLSFTLLVVLTIYATRRFVHYSNSTTEVDNANKAIAQVHIIEGLLKDIDLFETELPYKNYEKNDAIHRYLKKQKEVNGSIDNLNRMVKDRGPHSNTVMLKSNLAMRKSALRTRLRTADSSAVATYDSTIALLRQEADRYTRRILDAEYGDLRNSFAKRNTFRYEVSETMIYLLTIFYIVTLLLFVLMMYELRVRAEYQQQLQANLIDLRNAHLELEQVAFGMSHHLKEPIRKIKIFGDRLVNQKEQPTAAEVKEVMEKINSSAANLQLLVGELEGLTSLQLNGMGGHVHLEEVAAYILKAYKPETERLKADIRVGDLPAITGNKEQLTILFEKLLDNALKFSKPGVPPYISIHTTAPTATDENEVLKNHRGQKFHKIVIKDNGLGFDNTYNQKIFDLFQRLHSGEGTYSGKGTGLTIARRIMANHKGFITATGMPGQGVEIHLFFPAEK